MKLSECDRAVLGYLQLGANISAEEIKERLPYRIHQIRYSMKKLRGSEALTPRAMIDIFVLGYSRYNLYFALNDNGIANETSLREYLFNHENVSSILQVGGEYNYKTNLAVRSDRELSQFFDEIGDRFGMIFRSKALGLNVHHWVFGDRVLYPADSIASPLEYATSRRVVDIDSLDHEILRIMSSSDTTAPQKLAREVGKPVSTVHDRIKRLKKNGVIRGYTYELDGTKANLSNFILLLFAGEGNKVLQQELEGFAHDCSEVAYMSEDVGPWDFQIGISVRGQERASQLVTELRSLLGNSQREIQVIPMFKNFKVIYYPFKTRLETGP